MFYISVIIPTHNRRKSLLRTLESISQINLSEKDYEIIVVENACTDGTLSAIKIWQKEKTVGNLRVISENSIGLHFARHKGARMAKAEILIFTDDDATFSSDLMQAYIDAFDRYPEMVAAGGPVKPKWGNDPPKWLREYIGDTKIFSPLSLMEPYRRFRLNKKGFFFGVNMAIRKKILFQVGGFNPESIGKQYVGDGEVGLYKKLQQRGLLIGYVPDAVAYHHVPKERLTLGYFISRMKNEGISYIYGSLNNQIPGLPKLIFSAISIFLVNYKLWLAACYHKNKTDINSLNIQLDAAHKYAQVQYLLRLIFDKDLKSLVKRKNWLT